MIVIVIVSILALLLTWLETRGTLRWGMVWAFVLLTVIEAIHYDFGNDYMAYLSQYNEITRYPFNLNAVLREKESGWIILNYVFVHFGDFFGLVAFIAVIQNVIYCNFIRKYVPRKWWIMAVFIYLFNTNFYLLNMSMLRQGLAISLFVWAIPYIINKRLVIPITIILTALSIHSSAKILIPFLLWGWLPFGKRFVNIIVILVTVFMILLFTNQDFMQMIFNFIIETDEFQKSDDFMSYVEYYSGNEVVTFGLGFVMNLIPFVMIGYNLLRNHKILDWQQKLFCLSLIGAMIFPFVQIIPLISRISLYFIALTIVVIPIVYKWIPNSIIRYMAIFIFVFMTLYNYYVFFNDSVYSNYYSTYHTIFSVLY